MSVAISQAKKSKNDIPIGAIIVRKFDGNIVARARNTIEENSDPLRHAELNAIWQIEEKYLDGYDLYCTLQPCRMCAAAIEKKRINRIIFGAYRDGFEILPDNYIGGVCEQECSDLITEFFTNIRQK